MGERIYVSAKTVSSWEANRTEPSLDLIVRLAEILECSYASLIYGNDNKSEIETEIKIRLEEKDFKRLKNYLKNKLII